MILILNISCTKKAYTVFNYCSRVHYILTDKCERKVKVGKAGGRMSPREEQDNVSIVRGRYRFTDAGVELNKSLSWKMKILTDEKDKSKEMI